MKRSIIVLIVATVLLVACGRKIEPANTTRPTSKESVFSGEQNEEYSINDGMYITKRTSKGEVQEPYILINENKFTIISQRAVSYQPSGMFQLKSNENKAVMKSTYAEKDYCWIFQLVDNDTMKFMADESIVPESDFQWENGMIFILDAEDYISLEDLKAKSQEYLSGGTAGDVSTITNWDNPSITIIDGDGIPTYCIKFSDDKISDLVYQVEYTTTQDGVAGPIILYMDPDGTIIGVSPRE